MRSLVPKLVIAALFLPVALVLAPGAVAAPEVTGTFKVHGVGTTTRTSPAPKGTSG
jgi:hypothetical protein